MSMSIDHAVASLKTMFPNISADVIKLVLESNGRFLKLVLFVDVHNALFRDFSRTIDVLF